MLHQQIPRLECSLPINCFVSHVESPGEIWMKPVNYISKALMVPTPPRSTSLRIPENPRDLVWKYVMAPWEEDLYARARITDVFEHQQSLYTNALFIDEGKSATVALGALREMDSSLFYHPWQSLVVAMFGCEPARSESWQNILADDSEDPQMWDPVAAEELSHLLAEYPVIRVEPIADSHSSSNASGNLITALLWGVSDVKLPAHMHLLNPLFAFRSEYLSYKREFVSAKDQKIFDTARTEVEDIAEKVGMIPAWRLDVGNL